MVSVGLSPETTAGAGQELALPFLRASAKCAAPRRPWRPEVPEGGCLSTATSPGGSKAGPSHPTAGAQLT